MTQKSRTGSARIVVPERGLNGWLKRNPHLKFTAPAMTVLVLLSIVPTIFLLVVSLTNYQLGWKFERASFQGIGNYARLFSGRDRDFWHAIQISLEFMALSTAIEMVFGFAVALLLNAFEFKFKGVVIGILMIPLAMTPTIAGQMWKLMLNAEYGLINYFTDALFRVRISWLSNDFAFLSILIVDIWQFMPFVALISYAGLRSLPSEPFEAAMIDGASRFRTLINVTIPMMRKLIFLTLLLRAIDALKLFDTAFVLTQGGPGNTTSFLSLHVYRLVYATNGLIGRGAAVAVVLLVIVNAVSTVLIRFQRKGIDD